ncbi:uncharacterized protein LOC129905643 [Episyrphus balteatus]|uniref:uncharacterized protein LOC129905643 n=1 Tax=Episyrphus balteatus TaxID=286459 RepID=UPI002484EC94|nr:uncharacterized protein LOC129905643 [Episyrphus balteatus]
MNNNSTLLDNSISMKLKRINQTQKHILFAAMAVNKNVLESRAGDMPSRCARKSVWKKVVAELNMAGPEKDIAQWRKVYTDLRLGMRKKWNKARHSEYILTEYERRVIEACGMIEKPGYERENSADYINNFLNFLHDEEIREDKSAGIYADYFREDNTNTNSHYYLGRPVYKGKEEIAYYEEENSNTNNSNYYVDSGDGEFITCQPDGIDLRDEYDNEDESMKYEQEPSIECISDGDEESPSRIEEYREPSVECISDDEVEELPIQEEIKIESPHPNEEPIQQTETVPRPIEIPQMPRPIPMHCSEIPSVPSASSSVHLQRRKKIKNATLKEIKKMHRNLLKESKKQTALLRKLVQGMSK